MSTFDVTLHYDRGESDLMDHCGELSHLLSLNHHKHCCRLLTELICVAGMPSFCACRFISKLVSSLHTTKSVYKVH